MPEIWPTAQNNKMDGVLWKSISVILTSSVKFFLAPGASTALGFDHLTTILLTIAGGTLGVCVFYLGARLALRRLEARIKEPLSGAEPGEEEAGALKKKKVFTKRKRFYVRIKNTVGPVGLAFLTPAILSIPIGCTLCARFYPRNRFMLIYLLVSVCIWSVALTLFSQQVKMLFSP